MNQACVRVAKYFSQSLQMSVWQLSSVLTSVSDRRRQSLRVCLIAVVSPYERV